jgi:hypothetical protein
MFDRIVMLIIMRIKYRFLNYSLARNASSAQYVATNKENDMDKKLIKQLLDDDETRARIAVMFGQMADDAAHDELSYDDLMVEALNKLNDILAVGEIITIEVSDYMWVRGEYVRTEPNGEVAVHVVGPWNKFYAGKRVDLVIKAKEGESDV